MISIVEHIEYLLMHNDCVVIPQWGALIAHYNECACEQDAMRCPERWIGFNEQVNHNDGLIASSIVRRHGVRYDQAVQAIVDNVTAFRKVLQAGNSLPLGHLGVFALNAEGHLEFSPFKRQLVAGTYYGLRSFEFKTLKQQEQESGAVAQPAAGNRSALLRRSMRWVASIMLLVGLGLALSTPIVVDRDVQNASINLPAITATHNARPAKPAQPEAVKQSPVAVPRFSEGMPDEAQGRYVLVIATLSSQEQVDKFVAHASVKTQCRRHGKQFVVYAAQSDDYAALVRAMKRLPQAHRQSYIL